MPLETQILDLLQRWESLRSEGKELTPEELCADCPELLEEVRQRLPDLQGINRFMGIGRPEPDQPSDSDSDPSRKTATRDVHKTVDGAFGSLPTPAAAWPTINGYDILEELGQGGMGHVFKARQVRLGRLVALKIIRKDRLTNPDSVRRFQREAKATARLAHPNIVTLFDAGQEGDIHYLAMEYVEGTDLAQLVKERGPLPIPEACEYVRQAALGLQHAFERGLVHRDIKPSNLLLAAGGGTVKILDLGLARLEQPGPDDASPSALTEFGVFMGTADYMAPEQASNARAADVRSDLYSLGCTLFFLLTGQPPFPGGSFTDKVVKHAVAEPSTVDSLRPEVPPGLREAVRRLLAKKPDDRFQTPAELAEALAPFTCADGLFPETLSAKSKSSPLVNVPSATLGAEGNKPPLTTSFRRMLRLDSRFLKRAAIIAVLVLLAGWGASLLWPKKPPIGKPDEVARIRRLIEAGKFGEAFAEIKESTLEDSEKGSLEDNLLHFWLSTVRKVLNTGDMKDAARAADELLERFPGNLDALEIRDKVRKYELIEKFGAAAETLPDDLKKRYLAKGEWTVDQYIDAHFSLGATFLNMEKPDYSKARLHLAEALELMKPEAKQEKIIAKALNDLSIIGDSSRSQSKDEKNQTEKQRKFSTAIDCYADMVKYGQKFKDQQSSISINGKIVTNEYAAFWGADRLRSMGDTLILEDGFEKKATSEVRQDPQPVEAYQVYSRGLPEDVKLTYPAQVPLLSARNILCVKFDKKLKNKGLKNYPDPQTLITHAERAVELATSSHPFMRTLYIIDAHAAAYQCYNFAGRKKEGQAHLRAVLKMDGISADLRKKIEYALNE